MLCEYEAGNIWHGSQRFLWPFDSECECGGYRVGVSLNTATRPATLTYTRLGGYREVCGWSENHDIQKTQRQMEGGRRWTDGGGVLRGK